MKGLLIPHLVNVGDGLLLLGLVYLLKRTKQDWWPAWTRRSNEKQLKKLCRLKADLKDPDENTANLLDGILSLIVLVYVATGLIVLLVEKVSESVLRTIKADEVTRLGVFGLGYVCLLGLVVFAAYFGNRVGRSWRRLSQEYRDKLEKRITRLQARKSRLNKKQGEPIRSCNANRLR